MIEVMTCSPGCGWDFIPLTTTKSTAASSCVELTRTSPDLYYELQQTDCLQIYAGAASLNQVAQWDHVARVCVCDPMAGTCVSCADGTCPD